MGTVEAKKDFRMKTLQKPTTSQGPPTPTPVEETPAEPADPNLLTLEDIREHIRHIERAVTTKEGYYMARMVRGINTIRQKLNYPVLRRLVEGYFPANSLQRQYFMDNLPEGMDTGATFPSFRPKTGRVGSTLLPEVDLYLHLLLLIFLIDNRDRSQTYTLAKLAEDAPQVVRCADLLLERVSEQNRRTLDPLAARCYYFYARAYEVVYGEAGLHQLRGTLHARLRVCTLRHDVDGQAVLVNLLLRSYTLQHLYDQADKLVCRVTFPEQAPNSEWARYLYYLGLIKAIRLEYSLAHDNLQAALRKAPQTLAVGFRQCVHKLNVVVQLLLGELPDRSLFRQPILKNSLLPYFQVTQAVRLGNLSQFNEALDTFAGRFRADGTYTLILRVRHNVIKTGIKRISLSYSRIGLQDIAHKLALDNPDDVEFIVAKAIRDRVIDASINHEKGYVQTNETMDIYSTAEPFHQLNQRINFCLNIRNQSVKAMRYPDKYVNDNDEESAEERREREMLELETAKEMSEEDYDGF